MVTVVGAVVEEGVEGVVLILDLVSAFARLPVHCCLAYVPLAPLKCLPPPVSSDHSLNIRLMDSFHLI